MAANVKGTLCARPHQNAIIFANRKTTVRELAKSLQPDGYSVGEIHGDMDQSSRIKELDLFKDGKIDILCASDVAARGLDIKGVSHVFNYDTPWHPDDYVHRIGRTGRAGAKGRAFTLVTKADAEAIDNVEKLTKFTIPVYAIGGGTAPDADEDTVPEPRRKAQGKARAPEREPQSPRAGAMGDPPGRSPLPARRAVIRPPPGANGSSGPRRPRSPPRTRAPGAAPGS